MEVKIIAILAGVFAAIGFVLFGRSKDETQATRPTIEQVKPQVETPPPLLTEPIADPNPATTTVETTPETLATTVITAPTGTAAASTITSATSDETPNNLSEAPMSMAAFKAATQARTVAASRPTTNESATPAVRASAMATLENNTDQNTTAPIASPQVAPFSVKQDPERPETPALQNLSQDILLWGESGQLRHLPKLLQYAKHSDPQIRAYIAVALGQLATAQSSKTETQNLVAPLQQLAIDSDAKVQRLAKKALAAC